MRSLNKIAVVGHPSFFGGADTELAHQVKLWKHLGLEIHFFPDSVVAQELKCTFGTDQPGCVHHAPGAWSELEGLDVVSFCNAYYLEHLPQIRKFARTTSWVNCMTWNFPLEQKRHKEGLIDLHLYQTQHALHRVGSGLADEPSAQLMEFVPFFDADSLPMMTDRPKDQLTVGHLSRPDPAKFHPDLWRIWNGFRSPVKKSGIVMAWSEAIETKIGKPPEWVTTLTSNQITQHEFFKHTDILLMHTQTLENLPRVGFEAMASGTVMCVNRKGGWCVQVQDGITGFVCGFPREAIERASALAFEPNLRLAMATAARQALIDGWGFEASSRSWSGVFKTIAAIR